MKKFPKLPEAFPRRIHFPTPLSALILLCLMLTTSLAFAEVPISLTQQGRLLTTDGQPMKGSQTLLFEIYNQPTEGAVLWSDELEVDLGDTGFYTAILGTTDNPIDHIVLQGGQTFLQLVIDDKPLLPRLELTSVPYAQIANIARQAQSAAHAETATSSTTADHANTSGHADTAQSAATATTATIAEGVAPGSIQTSSIANQAVTAEKILSIPWSKITDPPTIPSYTGADFVTSGQSCSTAGQMVTGISASGTLICATPTDNDTKYTAGSGLALTGTTFSVPPLAITDAHIDGMSWTKISGKPAITSYAPTNFVTSSQNCTGTRVITGFSATGTVVCAEPKDTTYTAAPNQGLQLSGTQFAVAPQGILTGHLASGAVTGEKIATSSIATGHISSGAITADKIATSSITTGHISSGAITADKIGPNAITGAKIATSSITTNKIADGAITIDKLASTVPLYQVTATNCPVPAGGVSLDPTCMPIQPSSSCSICSPPTIGGPQRYPYLNCQGTCVCLLTAPVCMNQKIGAILFDPEP